MALSINIVCDDAPQIKRTMTEKEKFGDEHLLFEWAEKRSGKKLSDDEKQSILWQTNRIAPPTNIGTFLESFAHNYFLKERK